VHQQEKKAAKDHSFRERATRKGENVMVIGRRELKNESSARASLPGKEERIARGGLAGEKVEGSERRPLQEKMRSSCWRPPEREGETTITLVAAAAKS